MTEPSAQNEAVIECQGRIAGTLKAFRRRKFLVTVGLLLVYVLASELLLPG